MRNSARSPKTMAATYHWMSSAAAKRMTTGMRKSHPSGANGSLRIAGDGNASGVRGGFAVGGGSPNGRRSTASKKASWRRPFDQLVVGVLLRGDRVIGLVRADPGGHLVLQMEFALLQRLLFELFVFRDRTLVRQFAQARFTGVMLFEPDPELFVFGAENLLNVSEVIRHPFRPPSKYRVGSDCNTHAARRIRL